MEYARLFKFPQYFRNIQRVSEIMAVLAKHGFGDFVNRLNLAYGKSLKRVNPVKIDSLTQRLDAATRLRLVFEELGPTFIKLGQLSATRPDIFPPSFINEFQKLQDNVPAFDSNIAIKLIESELNASIENIFLDFDNKILAAGSIAQVHKATLKDGTKVVVKIQRPNIERQIDSDMDIVKGLTSLLEEVIPTIKTFNIPLVIEEFHRILKAECDFRKEANNMLLFAEQHSKKEDLIIPKTFPELCSKKIITQELIQGRTVRDFFSNEHITPLNNSELLVKTLSNTLLDSIFIYRFYHADPHPGNIIITNKQKLALLDFGEMGRVDKQRIRLLLDLLIAILAKNPERMLHIMQEYKMAPQRINEANLRVQLTCILDNHIEKNLSSLNLSNLLTEVFDVVRNYGITLPADILMIAKAITLIESVAAILSPTFKPAPFVKSYIKRRYLKLISDPKTRLLNTINVVESYKNLGEDFPRSARTIINNLATGETTIQACIKDFPTIKKHQNKMLNRSLTTFIGIFFIFLALSHIHATNKIEQFISFSLLLLGTIAIIRVFFAIKRNDNL